MGKTSLCESEYPQAVDSFGARDGFCSSGHTQYANGYLAK
jgi:hypothetical protein